MMLIKNGIAVSEPSYLEVFRTGELERRIKAANDVLSDCTLCPHMCHINRLNGEKGRCRSGYLPRISSYNVHKGEEPPLTGTMGSGTIFFTNCTLSCLYCQNYPISQLGIGRDRSISELARIFLSLQKKGCHNLNLVTPTHFVPQIMEALLESIKYGFNLPLVYNCSGYERVQTLKLLEGVIDIYLPDIRYSDNSVAVELSLAEDYVEYNRAALREMYSQVGDLKCDGHGIAKKGLIVRHLVLPNGLAGSEGSLDFLSDELSPKIHLALMSQYFPAYKAGNIDRLNRKISKQEYNHAVILVEERGFDGWVQPLAEE